ncbi:MAG: hypothetical protein ACYTF7_03285 [Planctomycetota bacterium]|jgi:hypothetical protein
MYRYLVVLLVFVLTSLTAMAQLTPPGPPADSFKSLDEVEPRIPLSQETTPGDAFNEFIITQTGSYYLTGDVVTSVRGIDVAADGNVTIELNGFTIESSSVSQQCVFINASVDDCVIRNGALIGGNGTITTASTLDTPNSSLRVEGVDISSSLNTGVTSYRMTTMRNVVVRDSSQFGVRLLGSSSYHSSVEDVKIVGSVNTGLAMTHYARVRDTTIADSTSTALSVGRGSDVSGVLVVDYVTGASTSIGVIIGESSIVRDSVFRDYLGTTYAMQLGLRASAHGITVDGATGGTGILMKMNSKLLDSLVDRTLTHGLRVESYCTVRGNDIENSGVETILADDYNVIDGNRCYRSIRFGDNNIVVRNTVSFGSVTALGAGNEVGPINDLTSPWSNFQK